MSNEIVVISKSKLTNIANALRTKLNTNSQYTLDEMVTAINSLEAPQIISVTGINIPSTLTVYIGSQSTISRTITPNNASNKNIIWQISDSTTFTDLQGNPTSSSIHANLTSDGKITGTIVGTCYVKATTEDGGFTDECTITVVKNSGGGTAI